MGEVGGRVNGLPRQTALNGRPGAMGEGEGWVLGDGYPNSNAASTRKSCLHGGRLLSFHG